MLVLAMEFSRGVVATQGEATGSWTGPPAPTRPGRKCEPGWTRCSKGMRRCDVREKTSRSKRGRCPCNGTERSGIRGFPTAGDLRSTTGGIPVRMPINQ
jgi:hypothetical protein